MRSILYYEHDKQSFSTNKQSFSSNKKSKSLENMKPIYHEGPFWAFWLIELFDKIANFGLDLRFKLEDRFTFQVDKRRKVRHRPKVYN